MNLIRRSKYDALYATVDSLIYTSIFFDEKGVPQFFQTWIAEVLFDPKATEVQA